MNTTIGRERYQWITALPASSTAHRRDMICRSCFKMKVFRMRSPFCPSFFAHLFLYGVRSCLSATVPVNSAWVLCLVLAQLCLAYQEQYSAELLNALNAQIVMIVIGLHFFVLTEGRETVANFSHSALCCLNTRKGSLCARLGLDRVLR
jgi:hypothetical protein